jgi:hypothetical protein
MKTFKEKIQKKLADVKSNIKINKEIKQNTKTQKSLASRGDKIILSKIKEANKISNPLKKQAEKTRQITNLASHKMRTNKARGK